MARNSERFITAFNRIDKALDRELHNSRGIGFSKAVRILAKYNAVVSRYKDELLEFAELRNAIVHNRMDTLQVIAEPHDAVVEEIEKIESELTKPKRVVPTFKRQVHTFQLQDSLSAMLDAIQEKGYSKFPVYEENTFKGLVTESGVTKWLAQNKNRAVKDVLLKDILPFQKANNHMFISSDSTVYDAVEVFKEEIGNGHRIDALLVTKNGEKQGKLEGIITAWDIMSIE